MLGAQRDKSGGQVGPDSNRGWGAASHSHPASVPPVWFEELWGFGCGGGAVGIYKKTVSPKFHAFAAVSEATRSPVVFKPKASLFIKNENNFFLLKRGSLVEGQGPYFTSVRCQPKWQTRHNKRSHLASCFGTDNGAGVIPLVIAAASK